MKECNEKFHWCQRVLLLALALLSVANDTDVVKGRLRRQFDWIREQFWIYIT